MKNSHAIHDSFFATDFRFVFKLTPTACAMVRCSPPVDRGFEADRIELKTMKLVFTDSPLITQL